MDLRNLLPDPGVEIWDYAFSQDSSARIYFARPASNPTSVVTVAQSPMWRYLVIADSEEQLREDLKRMGDEDDFDVPEIKVETASLGELLLGWRLFRYNGKLLCASECDDITPNNPQAWPSGPPAPVRNGFAYVLVEKSTGKARGRDYAKGVSLPFMFPTINTLLDKCDDLGINVQTVFDDHHIVATNLLSAAIEYPVVLWQGKPFPLFPCMNLNPNHVGDPEEMLLSGIDSQANNV